MIHSESKGGENNIQERECHHDFQRGIRGLATVWLSYIYFKFFLFLRNYFQSTVRKVFLALKFLRNIYRILSRLFMLRSLVKFRIKGFKKIFNIRVLGLLISKQAKSTLNSWLSPCFFSRPTSFVELGSFVSNSTILHS